MNKIGHASQHKQKHQQKHLPISDSMHSASGTTVVVGYISAVRPGSSDQDDDAERHSIAEIELRDRALVENIHCHLSKLDRKLSWFSLNQGQKHPMLMMALQRLCVKVWSPVEKKAVALEGAFLLTDPWWKIRVNSQFGDGDLLKMTGQVSYSLCSDTGPVAKMLIKRFLAACLVPDTTIESIYKEVRSMNSEKDLNFLKLGTVLDSLEAGGMGDLVEEVRTCIVEADAGRLVLQAIECPAMLTTLPQLHPHAALPLITKPQHHRITSIIQHILVEDPWILGFRQILDVKYGVSDCEATLENMQNSCIWTRLTQVQQDALRIYHILRDMCSKTSQTVVKSSVLKQELASLGIAQGSDSALKLLIGKGICGYQDLNTSTKVVYLMDVYQQEVLLADTLYRLLSQPQQLHLQVAEGKRVDASPECPESGALLELIRNNPITVLSRHYGHGINTDSSLAHTLISCIKRSSTEGAQDGISPSSAIILVPTDTASKRFDKLSRELQVPCCSVLTIIENITRALKQRKKQGDTSRAWEYSQVKLLFIEQCDQLSVRTLTKLLEIFLTHGSLQKLVLIGDKNMLPKPGQGRLFLDLYEAFDKVSGSRSVGDWHKINTTCPLIASNLTRLQRHMSLEFDQIRGFHFVKVREERDATGYINIATAVDALLQQGIIRKQEKSQIFTYKREDCVNVYRVCREYFGSVQSLLVRINTIDCWQLSTVDTVIYILGDKSDFQNWQHLYTAIACSSQTVYIIGQQPVLKEILEFRRPPHLQSFLHRQLHKWLCGQVNSNYCDGEAVSEVVDTNAVSHMTDCDQGSDCWSQETTDYTNQQTTQSDEQSQSILAPTGDPCSVANRGELVSDWLEKNDPNSAGPECAEKLNQAESSMGRPSAHAIDSDPVQGDSLWSEDEDDLVLSQASLEAEKALANHQEEDAEWSDEDDDLVLSQASADAECQYFHPPGQTAPVSDAHVTRHKDHRDPQQFHIAQSNRYTGTGGLQASAVNRLSQDYDEISHSSGSSLQTKKNVQSLKRVGHPNKRLVSPISATDTLVSPMSASQNQPCSQDLSNRSAHRSSRDHIPVSANATASYQSLRTKFTSNNPENQAVNSSHRGPRAHPREAGPTNISSLSPKELLKHLSDRCVAPAGITKSTSANSTLKGSSPRRLKTGSTCSTSYTIPKLKTSSSTPDKKFPPHQPRLGTPTKSPRKAAVSKGAARQNSLEPSPSKSYRQSRIQITDGGLAIDSSPPPSSSGQYQLEDSHMPVQAARRPRQGSLLSGSRDYLAQNASTCSPQKNRHPTFTSRTPPGHHSSVRQEVPLSEGTLSSPTSGSSGEYPPVHVSGATNALRKSVYGGSFGPVAVGQMKQKWTPNTSKSPVQQRSSQAVTETLPRRRSRVEAFKESYGLSKSPDTALSSACVSPGSKAGISSPQTVRKARGDDPAGDRTPVRSYPSSSQYSKQANRSSPQPPKYPPGTTVRMSSSQLGTVRTAQDGVPLGQRAPVKSSPSSLSSSKYSQQANRSSPHTPKYQLGTRVEKSPQLGVQATVSLGHRTPVKSSPSYASSKYSQQAISASPHTPKSSPQANISSPRTPKYSPRNPKSSTPANRPGAHTSSAPSTTVRPLEGGLAALKRAYPGPAGTGTVREGPPRKSPYLNKANASPVSPHSVSDDYPAELLTSREDPVHAIDTPPLHVMKAKFDVVCPFCQIQTRVGKDNISPATQDGRKVWGHSTCVVKLNEGLGQYPSLSPGGSTASGNPSWKKRPGHSPARRNLNASFNKSPRRKAHPPRHQGTPSASFKGSHKSPTATKGSQQQVKLKARYPGFCDICEKPITPKIDEVTRKDKVSPWMHYKCWLSTQ